MLDDTELYRRWLEERDEGAFATLARRHANLVYDVAWRMGGDEALAEDALQEGLLRLATDGTEKPARVGVRAWLARLAISKARNARASARARARRERKVGVGRTEAGMDEDAHETRRVAEAALARCSGEDAAILSLRYLHGLDHAELATMLGVTESTSRVKVHRALGRVREAAKRDDLDKQRLAGVLAAIPMHVAPPVTVEAAITAAVGSATVAVAGVAAASWLPRAVAAVVLLLAAGGGVLWWVGARGASQGKEVVVREHASAEGDSTSTLRGRPRPADGVSVASGAGVAKSVTGPEPSKREPVPQPVRTGRADAPEADMVPLRVRLLLVHGDRTEEEIEIAGIWHQGNAWRQPELREHAHRILVEPGRGICLETADPRAAVPVISAPVPEAPEELLVRVPAKDYEGLDELVLEVVDAAMDLPIPTAWLEWGSAAPPHARVPADRNGRIAVRIPECEESSAADSEPALWRFCRLEHTIQAPGYVSVGDPWGTKEYVASVLADDLETWLERGVKRIALKPLPRGYAQRPIRILEADGRPAAGAYVLLVDPVNRDFGIVPLMKHWNRRFRRTDGDGRLTISVNRLVGLQVQQQRVPVASWGLSAEAWPERGPRTLRLPAIAQAELVVEGLPEGTGGWCRDPLGAKRSLHHGNAFPMDRDPQAAALMEEKNLALPVLAIDARGDLAPPSSTMRLPLPVGRSFTLHLHFDDQTERTWTVKAEEPGPLRLTRRWEDLPRAP